MDNLIGERLKSRRKELHLTLTDVHAKIGISTGNLSDIERGKYLPSASMIVSLSELYECDTDWILKGKSLISDNLVLTDNECLLLHIFRELPYADQEEVLGIISLKQNRLQRELLRGKSSHSADQIDDAKMA